MSESKMEEIYYQITGADNHLKSRQERLAQTPKTDIIWSGKVGMSKAYPEDLASQELLSNYGRKYVSYDRTGEPDFTFCAEASVKISDMSENRSQNFSSAGKKVLETKWAKDRGITNLSELNKYRQENGLTWHERSDGVTMDLVPSEINHRFGHSGGVAELGTINAQNNSNTDNSLLRKTGQAAGTAGIYTRQAGVIISESIQPAIKSGEDAAMMTFVVSSLNNITLVVSGDKSPEDAAKDVLKDTATSFGSAAGITMTQEVTVRFAQKMGAGKIAELAATKVPINEIVIATMTFNTIKDYLDGKMPAEDCAFQLVANVAGTIAYQLGSALTGGCPVGGVIASMVMSQVIGAISSYRQDQKIQKARAAELDHLLSCAKAEIARQQDYLRDYVQKELGRWDNTIDDGFKQMLTSALNDDSDGITAGLNTILALFDSRAYYQSLDEFDRDFLNPDAAPVDF